MGNAAGGLFSSWLNPVSILIGALAVATGAYLAAVFLSGDAGRAGEPELAARFRVRALAAGVVAIGGLVVLHADAHRLYHELVAGRGLPALAVSVAAGTATLALVWLGRFELARYCAALAVAAIVAGWALAQSPQLLPGLTARQAAAPHDTQVAVLVAILGGGAILLPSLITLFRLQIGGRLAHGGAETQAPPRAQTCCCDYAPPRIARAGRGGAADRRLRLHQRGQRRMGPRAGRCLLSGVHHHRVSRRGAARRTRLSLAASGAG